MSVLNLRELKLSTRINVLHVRIKYNRFVNEKITEKVIKLLSKQLEAANAIDARQDEANELFDAERSRIIAEQEARAEALTQALANIPVETEARVDALDKRITI